MKKVFAFNQKFRVPKVAIFVNIINNYKNKLLFLCIKL